MVGPDYTGVCSEWPSVTQDKKMPATAGSVRSSESHPWHEWVTRPVTVNNQSTLRMLWVASLPWGTSIGELIVVEDFFAGCQGMCTLSGKYSRLLLYPARVHGN